MLGDKRSQVASFSFLMVILPILGEALLDVKHLITEPGANSAIGLMPLLIGFIASFIVGCISCKWMIEMVKKGKLIWFAIYCIIVGILCIVW
jgi:undecaprenyl-diphosphatase